MIHSKVITCWVWLLGSAIALTGLYSGLDHWGRFFPKQPGQRPQMPLDAVADASFLSPASGHRGTTCICSHCVRIPANGLDGDDYTRNKPHAPVGDRLTLWLCDDDDGQKQHGLSSSPADAEWTPVAVDPSSELPSDEELSSPLSLNSLHVRLQI